jgi:hypothetical protein
VHQQPTLGVDARFAVAVPPRAAVPDRTDRLGLGPGEDEFGGVLDNQDRPGGRFNAAPRGREVTGQDRVLAKAAIGKEAVGGLRAGPVLTSKRQRLADGRAKLP